MQDKKQQLELDIEQQTGSKLNKKYIKAVYCLFNPPYLTYMKSISCEMLGWIKHKLESRLFENGLIGKDLTNNNNKIHIRYSLQL